MRENLKIPQSVGVAGLAGHSQQARRQRVGDGPPDGREGRDGGQVGGGGP